MGNLRIAGLASGMDTDAMVQSMMKVERLKVDRYEQSKQIALWRQEAYTSMNKMFANFILNTRKSMGLTKVTSTGVSIGNSYSNLDYIRKATSSNETVATVSTTSKAVNGSYNIEVDKLANGASFTSAVLKDANGKELAFDKEVKFELSTGAKDADGKEIIQTITVENANGVTADDIVKKINSAKVNMLDGKVVDNIENLSDDDKKKVKEVSLGVSAFYDKGNGRLFMQTTETGKDAEIKLSGVGTEGENFVDKVGGNNLTFTSGDLDFKDVKSLEFELNGIKIMVEGETPSEDITIDKLLEAINAETDAHGVTAIEKDGKLVLTMEKAGENAKIELTNITGDTNNKFDNAIKNGSFKKDGALYNKGADAQIIFNGVELTYSSNNINLNGMNIELKSTGKTNMKVDTNIDGIMEKVQQFVNDYNELVDKASKTVNEKRYSKYQPLSQEEKNSMHENDVKLWEEKAKSGMLNSDGIIQGALQSIRTDLYRTVENAEGSFNHITQIGISTEKYSRGTTGGKLQIDEEKLRAAIEKDPEGVMELLFTEPSKLKRDTTEFPNTEEGNRKYELAERKNRRDSGGLFTRMCDNLIDGMKSIIDKSGPGEDAELFRSVKTNILLDFVTTKSSISDLDKEVLDANKKIDDLNVMLYRKENAYYAKFANMEKMLSQMYSQSNWLTQQSAR
ncbi:flagellar filament capping protein FliD [Tissierella praeacuta]|uniref:flagellar filament capping protein FliD n=1 Tax=Tissierella praeacuta TaxID=43131 RepID=UPI00334254B7